MNGYTTTPGDITALWSPNIASRVVHISIHIHTVRYGGETRDFYEVVLDGVQDYSTSFHWWVRDEDAAEIVAKSVRASLAMATHEQRRSYLMGSPQPYFYNVRPLAVGYPKKEGLLHFPWESKVGHARVVHFPASPSGSGTYVSVVHPDYRAAVPSIIRRHIGSGLTTAPWYSAAARICALAALWCGDEKEREPHFIAAMAHGPIWEIDPALLAAPPPAPRPAPTTEQRDEPPDDLGWAWYGRI